MTEQMRALVDRLNEAARAYYYSGEPIMSDKDYDAMYDELLRMEKASGVILPDSPTHRVGAEALTAFEPHTHISRLWSMDKVQSIDELDEWIRRTEKLTGRTDLQYRVLNIVKKAVRHQAQQGLLKRNFLLLLHSEHLLRGNFRG